MYSIIIEGTEKFVKDSETELVSKGFSKIGNNAFMANSISNFASIAKGLKSLGSYKKQASKNTIYKTSSLSKV